MKRILFALVLMIGLASCQGCHPSPTPVVNPTGAADAAPAPVTGPATCIDYCRHGVELGCAWAADTPEGATCLTFCLNYQKAVIAPWNLDCRTAATVCDPPSCQ